MNSLDKMEDYDRLKQERDELAAQVGVKDAALQAIHKAEKRLEEMSPFPDTYARESALYQLGDAKSLVEKSLSITLSSALREIEARVLEEAANMLETELSYSVAAYWLRERAAAKRKGE